MRRRLAVPALLAMAAMAGADTAPAPAGASLLGIAPAQEENEAVPDPERAFVLEVDASDPATVVVAWTIHGCCYLYRERLALELLDAPGTRISTVELPPGEPVEDEFFGLQEIYRERAVLTARLERASVEAVDVQVRVAYQGCAEVGVCYPPMSQVLPLHLPAAEPAR